MTIRLIFIEIHQFKLAIISAFGIGNGKNESFTAIRVQLEHHCIDDALGTLTKSYAKLFKDACNVVITDEKGIILYQLNDAYIIEPGTFHMMVDPWHANGYGSDLAYVVDSKNNLKYAVQLGTTANINALKSASAKNPLAKELYNRESVAENPIGDKEIHNVDGSSYIASADTTLVFDYSYIASKKMHLYAIYDSENQFSNFFLDVEGLFTIRKMLRGVTLIGFILFWIALPIWVYRDALNHNKNGPKWAALTFITNVIGLIFYLSARTTQAKCQHCGKALNANWVACPYCGEKTAFESSRVPEADVHKDPK